MTPFEIRLDLLKMSREMLEAEFLYNRDDQLLTYDTLAENARSRGMNMPERPALTFKYPSENDVIAKAEVLNKFVSTP